MLPVNKSAQFCLPKYTMIKMSHENMLCLGPQMCSATKVQHILVSERVCFREVFKIAYSSFLDLTLTLFSGTLGRRRHDGQFQ